MRQRDGKKVSCAFNLASDVFWHAANNNQERFGVQIKTFCTPYKSCPLLKSVRQIRVSSVCPHLFAAQAKGLRTLRFVNLAEAGIRLMVYKLNHFVYPTLLAHFSFLLQLLCQLLSNHR